MVQVKGRADRQTAVITRWFDEDVIERTLLPYSAVARAIECGAAGEAQVLCHHPISSLHLSETARGRGIGFFEQQLCRGGDVGIDRLCDARRVAQF